jgi:hypothetical protein
MKLNHSKLLLRGKTHQDIGKFLNYVEYRISCKTIENNGSAIKLSSIPKCLMDISFLHDLVENAFFSISPKKKVSMFMLITLPISNAKKRKKKQRVMNTPPYSVSPYIRFRPLKSQINRKNRRNLKRIKKNILNGSEISFRKFSISHLLTFQFIFEIQMMQRQCVVGMFNLLKISLI